MTDQSNNQTDADRIADALIQWAGSAALILDHMARWDSQMPGQGSISDSFDRVVRGVLASLEGRHTAADLAVAAEVVTDAVEELLEEIMLVELPEAEAM